MVQLQLSRLKIRHFPNGGDKLLATEFEGCSVNHGEIFGPNMKSAGHKPKKNDDPNFSVWTEEQDIYYISPSGSTEIIQFLTQVVFFVLVHSALFVFCHYPKTVVEIDSKIWDIFFCVF